MGWFPTSPGGLNRYLYELINYLGDQQNSIELCGTSLPVLNSNAAIQLTNLAQADAPLMKRLWSSYHASKHLRSKSFDAINLHFSLYSLPVLENLPKHVPITFHFHGPWALESQQEGAHPWSFHSKQWIEQWVYQRCDRFIVLSQFFGDMLHRTYRVPWDKIHLIPGGVNTDRFRADLTRQSARQRLNWPCDRPIFFAPRRLVRRMGLETLLTAMAQIKSQVPDIWLGIAGRGPLHPLLSQQIAELNLQQQVSLLGYLSDQELAIAYQAADLTVVPSQSLEGFGLILLESLACGTPVACTPVGGMPEVIQPFSPALVAESTQANAIATRLIDLLQHRIPLPSREECRTYAQQFDWTRISQKVRHVLLA